jgi:hypothetical protein
MNTFSTEPAQNRGHGSGYLLEIYCFNHWKVETQQNPQAAGPDTIQTFLSQKDHINLKASKFLQKPSDPSEIL